MKPLNLLSCLVFVGVSIDSRTVLAQTYQPSNRIPVADNTLIKTQVSGSGNNFDITGGLSRGQTLFHSFTDFSIPTNGQANFNNPAGNRDIITRVTGSVFSDINGTLNSNGANFLLINPNGIVFGNNARLNVGKAFVGTTANSIDLVGGGGTITFGTNPNGDAPLLSVAPNVLFDVSRLNLGGGTGSISNFGRLQVTEPDGYIGLIGGNVAINGGKLFTLGGRVEFGGLSAPGSVEVGLEGTIPKLNFPANVVRSDVLLTNGADIDTFGAGGGDIVVTARNLAILNGSAVRGGIFSDFGTPETVAGDIKLTATGAVFVDASTIGNGVQPNATGTGGKISIEAGSLSLANGSILATATFGRGNAGNIIVTAKDAVSVSDKSIVASSVQAGAVGNSGSIAIDAGGSLSVATDSQIGVVTFGRGNAGNIIVTAKDAVSLTDASFLRSAVEAGAVGNGGNIQIDAGSLSLNNKSQIGAGTQGQGNAGNLTIAVKDTVTLTNSALSSFLQVGGVGNGGNIQIDAGSLSLSDNSLIATPINGRGNGGNIIARAKNAISLESSLIASNVRAGGVGKGGNIDIKTNALSMRDGAQLQTSTFGASDAEPAGKGDAGNIDIQVTGALEIAGSKNGTLSGATSSINSGAEGNGGNITIDAGSMSFREGAGLIAQTAGVGNAGNIKVTSPGNITFDSTAGIVSRVTLLGVGNGGNITVEGSAVSFKDGAGLNSETSGRGNAGTIRVNARDSFFLSGEGNLSRSDFLVSGGGLFVRSQSETGSAGDIVVISPKITLDNNATITAQSDFGRGGNIIIGSNAATDLLLLRRGTKISTSAGGNAQQGGDGGNININSKLIVAIPTENSDITADAVKGAGGRVDITSQGLFGIKFRPIATSFTSDITASSTFGQSGTVNIDTPGTDPGRDSTELPNATTDASNQISQACSASNRQNKFIVAGRGGIPANADDVLTSDVVWQDDRASSRQPAVSSATNNPTKLAPPAVGMVFDGKGKVTLIAAGTPGQPTGNSITCPKVVGKQ